MSTAGSPSPQSWRELYQLAFQELNPVKLPQRIADARVAVLNRIEETLRSPGLGEQQILNDALNGLRVLHEEYDRHLQRYGELRAQPNSSADGKNFVQKKSA